jgi:hypothetical protein
MPGLTKTMQTTFYRSCVRTTSLFTSNVIAPFLRPTRNYAIQKRQVESSRASRLKLQVFSLSDIADPFLPDVITHNKPTFTMPGLKARWQVLAKKITTFFTMMRIKRNSPGKFKIFQFPERIGLDLYKSFHTALAKQDISTLRRICTEGSFSEAKRLMKGAQSEWNLESVKEAKVLHAHISDIQQVNKSFGQITVKFVTTQKVGKEVVNKVEYIVFERCVFDPAVSDHDCFLTII